MHHRRNVGCRQLLQTTRKGGQPESVVLLLTAPSVCPAEEFGLEAASEMAPCVDFVAPLVDAGFPPVKCSPAQL